MSKQKFIKKMVIFLIFSLILQTLPLSSASAQSNSSEASGFSINSMLTEHAASSSASQTNNSFKANSFNGSAGYNYTFNLPAGRANITPALALDYNSLNKNDFNTVGYGWSLIGLNYIERTNKDGINNIYQSDIFQLNLNGSSNKIINLNEEISDTNNQYNFENNTWTIKSSDGLNYYFGLTDNTRLSNEKNFYNDQNEIKPVQFCQDNYWQCQNDKSSETCIAYTQYCKNKINTKQKGTSRWYLNKIVDPNGNTIEYSYNNENSNHSLATINWGGNEAIGLEHLFSVDFIYENRPDNLTHYVGLMAIQNTQRLKALSIKTKDKQLREYFLNYTTGDNQTRSLLHSIDVKGYNQNNNTETITDLELSYYQNISKTYLQKTFPDNVAEKQLIDINGDGLLDAIKNNESITVDTYKTKTVINTNEIYLQDKNGNYNLSKLSIPVILSKNYYQQYSTNSTYATITNNTGYQWLDINADSLVDIIGFGEYYRNTSNGFVKDTFPEWEDVVYIQDIGNRTGIGSFSHTIIPNHNGLSYIDMNQDGYLDKIYGLGNENLPNYTTIKYYQPEYQQFNNLQPVDFGPITYAIPSTERVNNDGGMRFVDLNADGLTDIISSIGTYHANNTNLAKELTINSQAWLNTGNGFKPAPEFALPVPIILHVRDQNYRVDGGARFTDYNGDGLIDVIINAHDGCYQKRNQILLNTGNGWFDSDLEIPFITGGLLKDNHHNVCPEIDPLIGFPVNAVSLADINSDGVSDFYSELNYNQFVAYNTNLAYVDTLKTIKTFTGQRTELTYKNTKDDYREQDSKLPYIYYVLDTVKTYDDAILEKIPIETMTYNYYGGFINKDNNNPLNNRSAGFKIVKVTNNRGVVQTNYYHQGEQSVDMSNNGEYQDHYSKIGRVYRSDITDSQNILQQRIFTKWEHNGNINYFVYPSETVTIKFNDNNEYLATATTYEFDTERKIKTKELNYNAVSILDIQKGTWEQFDTVINASEYKYTSNQNFPNYIRPCEIILTDGNNTPLQKTRLYYDNLDICLQDKGLSNKVQLWNDTNNKFITTQKIEYNSVGLQTQISDALDNPTRYIYDDTYLYPNEVINALDHSNKFNYSLNGNLLNYTAPTNSQINYSYDIWNRVIKIEKTDPANTATQNTFAQYVYSNNLPLSLTEINYLDNKLTQQKTTYLNAAGNPILHSQQNNNSEFIHTYYSYDANGNVITTTKPIIKTHNNFIIDDYHNYLQNFVLKTNSYDDLNRLLTTDNTIGNTKYQYDIKFENNTNTQRIIDLNDNFKDTTYDIRGNLVAVTEYLDNQPVKTNYKYNNLNKLIEIIDANDNHKKYVYNSLGNLLEQHEPHKIGVLPHKYQFTYDIQGNLITKTDPNGNNITYKYDKLNRIIREINNNNNEIKEYTYDNNTNYGLLSDVNTTDINYNYNYDALGRLSSENKLIKDYDTVNSFNYNYEYNQAGLITKKIFPDNSNVSYNYDSQGRITSASYNSSLTQQTLTDNIIYNEAGQLIAQQNFNGTAVNKNYDRQELYRLKQAKVTLNETALANYNTEPQTKIISKLVYEDNFTTSKSSWQLAYHWRTYGYYSSYYSRRDIAPRSFYNSLNVQTYNNRAYTLKNIAPLKNYEQEVTVQNSPYVYTRNTTFDFIAKVNEQGEKYYIMTARNKVYIYRYSNNYQRTLLAQSNLPFYLDRNITYKTRLKLNDNQIYFKIWRKQDEEPIEWSLQASDDNPIVSGKPGLAFTSGRTYYNDLVITQPVEVEAEQPIETKQVLNDNDILSLNYNYDKIGNITQIDNNINQETTIYNYDDIYRLTSTSVKDQFSRNYKYDKIGNIINKSDIGLYQYNNQQQPMAANIIANTKYNYDNNGNLINDEQWQYSWNSNNQLMRQEQENATINYKYDHTGNRILKQVNNETTVSPSQDYRILPTGTIEKEIIVGDSTFVITTTYQNDEPTETITVVHQDHLGSATVTTDKAGHIVANQNYYPYGDTRNQTGISNTRQYTGQINDLETNLYYYNARYYNPVIGRFISVDPVARLDKSVITDPQQLNYYNYARNNPVIMNDPTGLMLDTVFDIGCLIYDGIQYTFGQIDVAIGKVTNDQYLIDRGEIVISNAQEDMVWDGAAVFLPLIPAGTSKVARGIKYIDELAGLGKIARKFVSHGDEISRINRLAFADDILNSWSKHVRNASQFDKHYTKHVKNNNLKWTFEEYTQRAKRFWEQNKDKMKKHKDNLLKYEEGGFFGIYDKNGKIITFGINKPNTQ